MMLLSRFWFAIVAVAVAAAIGFVYIGIHEHNRIRETDTYEIVNHDRDIVDWFLQLDARRRLDALGIVSVDSSDKTPSVVPLLVKANGQDKIDATTVREPMKKRLNELATKMSQLVRDEGAGGKNPVMLFAVDAHGRVVGSANFDRLNLVKEDTFELGGFPVVYDAMHGWLRDDTWVLDNDTIYRVVARPVVAAQNAPPVGAVVALRRVDDSFAHLVADKTNAPVAFYVDPPGATGSVAIVGRDAPDKSGISWDGFTIDEDVLVQDKFYNGDAGASSLKSEKDRSVVYSRMVGTAWDQGAGYAVARKVSGIADPAQLLSGATSDDRKSVPWVLVIVVGFLALAVGIGVTFVEHTLPLNKLLKEAEKLRKGDTDVLPLAKLSGSYRKIGQDVNEGFERIIAKGGGTSRKAADLSQVLGEIPAAPQMSAFSFGLQGDGGAAPASGSSGSNPGVNDLFPNLPPAGAAPPATPPQPAAGSPSRPQPPTSQPRPGMPIPSTPIVPPEDDEATQVARIPDELMRAAQTGEQGAIDSADELVQWRATFDEFVATRQRLGESTQGLSFEKFQLQLKKNKEQLVKQYNCRRVKFTVYEKEGKAALKATPIKE